jgi:hypothetical protein
MKRPLRGRGVRPLGTTMAGPTLIRRASHDTFSPREKGERARDGIHANRSKCP